MDEGCTSFRQCCTLCFLQISRLLTSQYPKLANISGGWLLYKALCIVDIKKLCTESFNHVVIFHSFNCCSFQVIRDNGNFPRSRRL